jgi:sialic acid synthase SpsE
MDIKIQDHWIGESYPTYFIADISANHDGDLNRAIELVRLAKEAGADAAKFQNFVAKKIVSDYGFKKMGDQVSHQASWKKSVLEVYEDASVPLDWTPTLVEVCNDIDIHYFTSPYDIETIDKMEPYLPAYKAGSGLMTYPQALVQMAKKNKPLLLATGASDLTDVIRVVREVEQYNQQLILFQCNTNYTASPDNYDHLNINVLKTYRQLFPNMILGLSDHTQSIAPVLGAVALGAKAIERHFTDDTSREGPDHKFSMDAAGWRNMVDETRILERSLGSSDKFITPNEIDTYQVQRRCLRTALDIKAGQTITADMIDVLRPATPGALLAWDFDNVVGKKARNNMPHGKEIRWMDLSE